MGSITVASCAFFRIGCFRWTEHLDSDSELALLARLDGSDAHDLARQLDTAVVGDRHHHRVLPRFPRVGMAKRSFHAKGGKGGDGDVPTRSESNVLSARRTHARALQDHRPAVRAGARRT